ncbi:ATP-dependent (S)-NAD(P)H-hydrate dehydratase [Cyclospora cayetanensis]|uniref:ATP-dependent (S)-NAD(P)H-hydrate dehydratase n=1 Tax=Cyclospora cayetanensis TaxID=88456 RepID=A0A6P6RVX6_9EIME|nr:ATP-dependent (S)-NAD(P)H-hydrate dehydratase [Cyclospora cayetanensis]
MAACATAETGLSVARLCNFPPVFSLPQQPCKQQILAGCSTILRRLATAAGGMEHHSATRQDAARNSGSCGQSIGGVEHNQKARPLLKITRADVETAEKVTECWLRAVERTYLPSLDFKEYKGRYGKVFVIGGCATFTGAPFFAATAALRMGADLAGVITTPSAAVAIKSYSPELLVYPILPCHYSAEMHGSAKEFGSLADQQMELARLKIHAEPLLSKADVIVLGPGLGGSTNYRPHEEQDARLHQGSQQQHQQRKSLEKTGSLGRLSHFIKDAIDMHRGDRGSSAPPSAAPEQTAAAADPTNPAAMNHALTSAAIREAEAAAAATQRASIMLLRLAMALQKPIVLDADMIRILCIPGNEHYLSLLAGYSRALLTPNAHELELLLRALRKRQKEGLHGASGGNAPQGDSSAVPPHGLLPESIRCEPAVQRVYEAAALLRGPCVFGKGRVDVLGAYEMQRSSESGGECECVLLAVSGLSPRHFGAPKRSGGQGDVLCGVLAQAFVWVERARSSGGAVELERELEKQGFALPFKDKAAALPPLLLMHAASVVTREAASLAFRHFGRSMTAQHIVDKLGAAGGVIFPSSWFPQNH